LIRVISHICCFEYDTARYYLDQFHIVKDAKEKARLEICLTGSLKMTYAESEIGKIRAFMEEQHAIKT
jgi:hypothetical protein